MDDTPAFTLKEYAIFCNGKGIFDSVDIQLAYKIYIALLSGDEYKYDRSLVNYYWNTYYRLLGKFN